MTSLAERFRDILRHRKLRRAWKQLRKSRDNVNFWRTAIQYREAAKRLWRAMDRDWKADLWFAAVAKTELDRGERNVRAWERYVVELEDKLTHEALMRCDPEKRETA